MLPAMLDPLSFPLTGTHLIEASAGTGKTTAISNLYLRLVLGHGRKAPLLPPQILVVTFTEAATQELRERIRARLAEAAVAFRADPHAQPAATDFIGDLQRDCPDDTWPAIARTFELAAEWMDEAAIFTIHGWANRMLREHAFASDTLFNQQLVTDNQARLAEAARDYWRRFITRLDRHDSARVQSWCRDPKALQKRIKPLIGHHLKLALPSEPHAAVEAGRVRYNAWLSVLKDQPWHHWINQFEAQLLESAAAKQFDLRKLRIKTAQGWLSHLKEWADDPELESPKLTGAAWDRLSAAGLHEVWKYGEPPEPEFIAAVESLRTDLAHRPDDGCSAFLAHAAQWIGERFNQAQAQNAEMGFDDLLVQLNGALHGSGGTQLGAIIREQFPAVLIDEFQDTDPIQYQIFDTTYDIAANNSETALVMIGDPKQAIYAFRGADIYTYLEARRACAGRLHTLARNYRASDAMVEAVNKIFGQAETRPNSKGAFRFKHDGDNPLPFAPAVANGLDESFWVSQTSSASPLTFTGSDQYPALSIWSLPTEESDKAPSKAYDREQIAAIFATQIVELLNQGAEARAGFVDQAGQLRALQPSDIAVLVNKGSEARLIRDAMRARGLSSVYLSERESVFAAPQAAEIELWLEAVAEPDRPIAIRSALASPSIALSVEELEHLNVDENALESRIEQFRGYQRCWQRQGVLPMLRNLLHDFDIPARLLANPVGGERALTDLLHIAELLQQASREIEGEHALVRYLREQRDADAMGLSADAPPIRLESDAALVQVVTVHKSKGLQYPLVFLPFAAEANVVDTKREPHSLLRWHDADGQVQFGLMGQDEAIVKSDQERLAEDIRKLYVALTRAEHAAWVGIAPRRAMADSALGYLLGGDGVSPGWDRHIDDHLIEPAQLASDECYRGVADTDAVGVARHYAGERRKPWWIASYSSLRERRGVVSVTTEASDAVLSARDEAVLFDDDPLISMSLGRDASSEPSLIHSFPRGPSAGGFLHDCLEWAAVRGFSYLVEHPDTLRDMVSRRCQVRGWMDWVDTVTEWLLQIMRTPLPLGDSDCALSDADALTAEMEFFVGVHNCDIHDVDALVRSNTLGNAARPAIAQGTMNGMLKGFIDLVFSHQGRYYVLDYKSNWLGPGDSAYSPEQITDALLSRRYDLQYCLYLLALHRLLSVRLPGYDYDQHVGGAVSYFLRGVGRVDVGVHNDRPPREFIEALDRAFQR